MKEVKYIGQKIKGIAVQLPIGCQVKSAFTGVIKFNPYAELEDHDAELLVKIDPNNFEISNRTVEAESPKKRVTKKKEIEKDLEIV